MTAIATLPDGRTVRFGTPFDLGGVAYPGNWLDVASQEERAERGISMVPVVPPQITLAAAKESGIETIRQLADERIAAGRTPGHGIAAIYDAQRAEMMEYLARVASGQPTPAELFPVLSALVGSAVGSDLAAVAETIRQRVTGEAQRLAVINRARLDGKAAVAAAATVEAVAAAVEAARSAIEAA